MSKTTNTNLLLIFIALCLTACNGPSEGGGDSYPTRPITYMVPWSAGGMTDMSSRMMAVALQKQLGQTVNVINRTGGGGVVGHLALSQARPDGYTVGAVTVEITQLHHMGLTDLGPANYTPLALMVNNPAAITVNIDAPYNSVEDLVAAIRSKPGELKASGTARGGIWDLARIGFLKTAGLNSKDLPWVPSQGSAPALQELIAGGVDVVTAALSEVDALRKAGQVKVLGVMADERLPGFPNDPTLKEQGLDWSIGGWVSICAPAGLPAEVKTKLDAAVVAASKDADYIEALTKAGSTIQFMNSADLKQFMMEQDELKGKLMQEAGLSKQSSMSQ